MIVFLCLVLWVLPVHIYKLWSTKYKMFFSSNVAFVIWHNKHSKAPYLFNTLVIYLYFKYTYISKYNTLNIWYQQLCSKCIFTKAQEQI